MSLLSPRRELLITSRCTFTLGVSTLVAGTSQSRFLRRKSSWASVSLWDQICSPMIQVRYFSGLSMVNLIFFLYCACHDICFLQYCTCDFTKRFEKKKVIFEFTNCKKKDLEPQITNLSNLWRLGLRGFSNNGLNFSFNCLVTSNRIFPWISSISGIIWVNIRHLYEVPLKHFRDYGSLWEIRAILSFNMLAMSSISWSL